MKRISIPVLLAMFTVALGAGVSHDVALAGQPIVEITKNCPHLRYLGRSATFEITVANKGDGPAHGVVVTDVITGALEFKSADNGGTREGNSIVWRLDTLAAGQSRTLKADFHCNQIGKITNKATVTYCAELSASCELEVRGIPAILLECVDDPDPIELNSSLTYTITVLNQGSAIGTNIVIACTLPPEEQHVSSTGPTKVTAQGRKVTFAPVKTLAPKASVIYKVTVKGVGEGDVRFHVQLTSDQTKTPVMETESTHIYN